MANKQTAYREPTSNSLWLRNNAQQLGKGGAVLSLNTSFVLFSFFVGFSAIHLAYNCCTDNNFGEFYPQNKCAACLCFVQPLSLSFSLPVSLSLSLVQLVQTDATSKL